MTRRMRVTATALNRRRWPEVADNKDGVFGRHTKLVEVYRSNGWSLVGMLEDWPGRAWWVSSNYLEPMPDAPIVDDNNGVFRFTNWPTEYHHITQPFGANAETYQRFGLPGHEGVDIRAPHGSPIYAVAPGTIVKVGDDRVSHAAGGHNYGVRVYIDHVDGFQTVYAHLDRRVVQVGESVLGGQLIGYADNTGNSNGSHLHLSLKHTDALPGGSRYIGYPYGIIDPMPYLRPLLGGGE